MKTVECLHLSVRNPPSFWLPYINFEIRKYGTVTSKMDVFWVVAPLRGSEKRRPNAHRRTVGRKRAEEMTGGRRLREDLGCLYSSP